MLLRTTTLRSLLSTTLKPRLLTTSTSATSTEPEPEPKPEPPHHPWPEWVTFVDRLKSRGYIYDTPSDHDPGFAYTDHQLLKDPCFSFARDRYDFLRSLPKADIRNIVDFGCPTLVRKVVLSAKRLREYAGLEEKNVCDVCSLRGTCDNAYVKPKDFDDPLTMDIMRLLLFYALDPMVVSRTKKPAGIEQVESSARRLLSMIIDSTEPSKRPASTELPKNSHKVLNSTAIVTGNAEWTQVVETRNAEWTCPKCKFLNYSRNNQCHKCNEGVPEKRKCELKKGDWVCRQCSSLNFARRTICHHCAGTRPPESLKRGDWVCPMCSFLNFMRNDRCLKCDTEHNTSIVSQVL